MRACRSWIEACTLPWSLRTTCALRCSSNAVCRRCCRRWQHTSLTGTSCESMQWKVSVKNRKDYFSLIQRNPSICHLLFPRHPWPDAKITVTQSFHIHRQHQNHRIIFDLNVFSETCCCDRPDGCHPHFAPAVILDGSECKWIIQRSRYQMFTIWWRLTTHTGLWATCCPCKEPKSSSRLSLWKRCFLLMSSFLSCLTNILCEYRTCLSISKMFGLTLQSNFYSFHFWHRSTLLFSCTPYFL